MTKLKSYATAILFLLLVITDGIHAAAVGKGVGGGGRGVKGQSIFPMLFHVIIRLHLFITCSLSLSLSFSFYFYFFRSYFHIQINNSKTAIATIGMRHNSRGRKGGAPRPVMTSSGIRSNANVVLEHANNPLHPHGGMRRPDEADAYYNNPYVSFQIIASVIEQINEQSQK